MNYCPNCGVEVKREDAFCNQCGESLRKICPQCGTEVGVDALFCCECGYSFMQNKEDTQKAESLPDSSEITKVPIFKRWWFWLAIIAVVVVCVLLASGGVSKDGKEIQTEEPSAMENVTDAQKTEDSNMSIKEYQKSMDAVLEDTFGAGYYETELDSEKNTYYIYCWIDDVTEALNQAREGDEEVIEDWNAKVGLLIQSCEEIKDQMDEAGLEDWSVALSLLDEETKSEVYVITRDGNIIFDILANEE